MPDVSHIRYRIYQTIMKEVVDEPIIDDDPIIDEAVVDDGPIKVHWYWIFYMFRFLVIFSAYFWQSKISIYIMMMIEILWPIYEYNRTNTYK